VTVHRIKQFFDSADYIVFRITTLLIAVYALWKHFW
jgi:hypothetical protein